MRRIILCIVLALVASPSLAQKPKQIGRRPDPLRVERAKAANAAFKARLDAPPPPKFTPGKDREASRAVVGPVGPVSPSAKHGNWTESNFGAGPRRFRSVGGKHPSEGKTVHMSATDQGHQWLWTEDGDRWLVLGEDPSGTLIVRAEGIEHTPPDLDPQKPAAVQTFSVTPGSRPVFAFGVGNVEANPLPVHGRLRLDGRNYGINTANADNGPATQTAHDAGSAIVAMIGVGNRPTVEIFIPAALSVYHYRSIVYLESPYIKILGEPGTHLMMSPGFAFPMFVVGMVRGSAQVPNASYRPDLFGQLDTSAASGTGQRWGIFTGPTGDLTVISWASHLSHGGYSPKYGTSQADKYGETKQLTIETAIKPGGGGMVPINTVFFGVSNWPHPGPYQLKTDASGPNSFVFYLAVQSAPFATPTQLQFNFSTGAATGIQKLAIQIDLIGQAVSVIANGRQIAVSGSAIPAGCTLLENGYEQFVINNDGSAPSGGQTSFTVLGLSLSRSIKYTLPGVGSVAARTNGATVNDQTRYFPTASDDPHFICCLGLTENPATAPRHIVVTGGPDGVANRNSSAFLINASCYTAGATQNVRFADLMIEPDVGYGAGVAMFCVLEIHFERMNIFGGAYAIGNIPVGANYQIYLYECFLRGADAGYTGFMSLILADRTTFAASGLCCFRLAGCGIRCTDVYVSGPGNPQYAFLILHGFPYGGDMTFDNVIADNEDPGFLFHLAGVYAEATPFFRSLLRVNNMDLGLRGSVPLFKLVQQAPGQPIGNAVLDVDHVAAVGPNAIIEQDGPGWRGIARNMSGDRSSHINNVGAMHGRVVVEDDEFASPPPYGQWYRNGSKFVVNNAHDGQYQNIRVSADGRMGTSIPPAFKGTEADQSSPNAMAAYMSDHTSISATVSGHDSSWGQPTDPAVRAMSAAMFRQTLPGTPANFRVGLSILDAYRGGKMAANAIIEPDPSTGYSAVTAANSSATFTTASAGVKASARSFSFNTATVAYTARSVFIQDAASTDVWASIQLATPLIVNVGDTPSIAMGGIVFTHTPLPGGQWGFLTDFGWKKEYDYGFGGVTFVAPASFFIGLTTGSAPDKTMTSLVEPSTSGTAYARAPVVNNATQWNVLGENDFPLTQQYGDATNIVALAFPTPTGSWGTITGCGLTDALTSGNVWGYAPIPSPFVPNTGTGTPAFAAGSLVITSD